MKRKVFFQVSIILYTLLVCLLSLMGMCIWLIIEYFKEGFSFKTHWVSLIIPIVALIFLAYEFVRFARNRIVLRSKEIFVPGHWGGKKTNGFQGETHIAYTDIKDVLLASKIKKNSNNIRRHRVALMPYIIVSCKNYGPKSINVFYFSNKQIVKMLDEIIMRAIKSGNILEIKTGEKILSDFLESHKKRE